MDAITAIYRVRDSLRDNLTDPYIAAGGDNRGGSTWIFSQQPMSGSKYPMIDIKKIDNPTEREGMRISRIFWVRKKFSLF